MHIQLHIVFGAPRGERRLVFLGGFIDVVLIHHDVLRNGAFSFPGVLNPGVAAFVAYQNALATNVSSSFFRDVVSGISTQARGSLKREKYDTSGRSSFRRFVRTGPSYPK